MINVLALTDEDIVLENFLYTGFDSQKRAENKFFALCEEFISDWDEYSPSAAARVLDQGYAEFENGIIVISHPVLDPDIEKPLTFGLNGEIIDSYAPYSC
jgi:hypothetical protein